jgi:rubredoxin
VNRSRTKVRLRNLRNIDTMECVLGGSVYDPALPIDLRLAFRCVALSGIGNEPTCKDQGTLEERRRCGERFKRLPRHRKCPGRSLGTRLHVALKLAV